MVEIKTNKKEKDLLNYFKNTKSFKESNYYNYLMNYKKKIFLLTNVGIFLLTNIG